MAVIGRISASEVMFELAFNITKQRGGAKPEQIGAQPAVAQFFFDQSQIGDGVFCLLDPARWFIADPKTCAIIIGTDGAQHDQSHWQGRIHAFLARRGFDEISSGHHAD